MLAGGDALALWAERTGIRRAAASGRGGVQFAFYGRVSTEDWQDPVTSRARQRQAAVLVRGQRWPRRPASRAATSAGGHPTDTGSPMPGRIRTRRTPRGDAGPTAWSPTPYGAGGGVDVHPAASRVLRSADHPGAERRRNPVPLGRRPQAQPAPDRRQVDAAHGDSDPGQPALHRPAGVDRQRTDFDLVDPANTALGHRQVQRWNLPEGWIISERPAHPALVSEADFIAAQDITAGRGPAGPAARRYLLAGLLACGQCGRRLESSWSNGRPAYRCRHGYTSATSPQPCGRRTPTCAKTRSCPT